VNRENAVELKAAGIVVDNPYAAYAIISALFNTHPNPYIGNEINYFVHATSSVDESVIIGPNVYVGPNCKIEKNTIIHANSSLVKNVHIGRNSIIHPNAVLGSDGFGYAPNKNGYTKIEQLGRLIIGSNVEIGAGCTIDRGAIDDTEIHDGVKLDNQVHVAHNVILGQDSAIAASCAIAGSTTIGKNFQMGGLSGVLGHLDIVDNVMVGAHTLITKSISKSGNYVGIMPAQDHKDWAKSSIFIKRRKI
jgi:UDP-3-O-[3-hydroxymyristoyl] glucosamine N-acyltransferase